MNREFVRSVEDVRFLKNSLFVYLFVYLVYILVKLKFTLINRYESYKANIVTRSRRVKYGIPGIPKQYQYSIMLG